MQQKRWLQIEEIFSKASNLDGKARSAYIDQACAGDDELRREVEELIQESDRDDNFLSNSGFSLVLDLFENKTKSLSTGEIIGSYKVIRQVGCGGMGEVYLAEDQRLARNVALKVLPVNIANKSLVDRFKNEARAASAISHPNVTHIYEIGETDKVLFIAMEFVEGENLRERLNGKSLTVNQAVNIALQTASALAAAHEKGIVHRDIKPENIIIRPDNIVKIVDFGIAKLTNLSASVNAENHAQANYNHFVKTEPGMLLGTTNYMSPEQLRSNNADARTDVWSLGVVLYESIAGDRPFRGDSKSDVIASILRNELPHLPPSTPVDLVAIIKKSLEKNAADRYSSASDFWLDLKKLENGISVIETKANNSASSITDQHQALQSTNSIHQELSASVARPWTTLTTNFEYVVRQVGTHYRLALLSLGLIAFVVVGANFAFLKSESRNDPSEIFQTMQFKKLTSKGLVSDEITAISRDGKYVAFVTQEGSLRSLWVKQVENTDASLIVAPAEVEYYSLNFSPNGDFIYYSVFVDKNKKSKELYQVPASGGSAQKLIDDVGDGHISLSPDGDRIAFVREGRFLMIADLNGSDLQEIAAAPIDATFTFPAWSPDGEIIVLAASSLTKENQHLVGVVVSDGTRKDIDGPPWSRLNGIAWLPDKSGLVISGRDSKTKLSQLWKLNYPSGKSRRITNDLNNYKSVSITANSKNIVSVQQERVSNIFTVPNGDAKSARRITFEKGTDDGLSGIALTSDGRVIYTSNQNGTRDLWIVNRDGTNNRQLTFNLQYSVFPAVSPDNRFVAFVSDQTGIPQIWLIDLNDGDRLKQLTLGPGTASYPEFSSDGKSIFYLAEENDKTSIRKVGIDGENPVKLIDGELDKPTLSPDGKFIASVYKATPDSSERVAIFASSGGRPINLLDLPKTDNTRKFRWSSDGQSLIYIDSSSGSYNLWSQPVKGGKPEKLTNFESGQLYRFAQRPDGREFTLAVMNESADAIMISNFD